MNKPTKLFIDIVIVFAVSALAFVLEDFANARGWIAVGAEARGATGVVVLSVDTSARPMSGMPRPTTNHRSALDFLGFFSADGL